MSIEPPGPIQHASPTQANAPPADAPRRALVLFFILTSAAIFVALFAILYVRWARAEEPSSVLIVEATPAFAGAEVEVDGIALPNPYKVRVEDRGSWMIPFYLDRGSYTLRISRDGHSILNADFPLQHNQSVRVKLQGYEHLLPPRTSTDTATSQPG